MRNMTKFCLVLITALVLLISAATPALAREYKTNIEGAPELEATAIGSNEFLVGQPGVLQIMVQNNGDFSGEIKRLNDKVMAVGYLSQMGAPLIPPCTTAVSITATLKSNVSSFEILNDTVVIGTLPSGGATMQPVAFQVRVDKNARPGSYRLNLELEYTYLEDVGWLNKVDLPEYVDELQLSPYYEPQFTFYWGTKIQSEYIPIEIKGTYFSAEVIGTENVRVGATGIITVVIENSGVGEATEVTAEIVPGGNFIPVDKGAFLSDLGGRESRVVKFKVEVSDGAIAKTSPLGIVIKYKDEDDVPRQSQLTVGIPIGEEVEFEIIQKDNPGIGVLNPGAEAVISVLIKNTGDSETRNVLARINVVDPFSSTDEISYMGTLQPGETGIAKFRISAEDDALPKPYALDVVVKYWDEEGNSYTSKPMKAELEVQQPADSTPMGQTIGIIAGVSAGLGYYLFNKRRKKSASAKS